MSLSGKAAIVGIGQTEFSKESGRSELQLACEAVKAAIDDAGLAPNEVDGMVTFTMDSSDEIEIARNVGIGDLTFFTRVHHGGGAAAGTVVQAAMAVATGTANAVVCYRAFNERSGFRFGGATARATAETPMFMANYAPFGLVTPAAWVALHAQRYMSTYGVTNEDFGTISVVDRAHAARNPDAWFYERPITIEDHQNSRWVIEPVLRLLDCCQESDGGVAIVITSAERARDLRQPPAVITAAVQGAAAEGEMMTSYYREDITGLPEMGVVAEKLWRDSGLKPSDIQTAFLYDHFTPFVFAQLEELGFCGRGEAKDFATVERLSLGGELPINTNGGLLGEAYIHGMNGITEGVRQVRGTVLQPSRQRRTCAGHLGNRRSYQRIDSRVRGLILEVSVTTEATATDTRELIIESAFECFRRHGLDKTTVVDIAGPPMYLAAPFTSTSAIRRRSWRRAQKVRLRSSTARWPRRCARARRSRNSWFWPEFLSPGPDGSSNPRTTSTRTR